MNRIRPLQIIFCLPGSNFSADVLNRWTDLIMSCPGYNIIPMLNNKENSNVYYVRNLCLGGDVLRGKDQVPYDGKVAYDYIMWIDSDILFNNDSFYRLLQHDKDIVAGLYMMNNGREFATVENWDIEFFKREGYFPFLTPEDIKNRKGLIEVSYTGMGFTLVKYGVFEKIGYPWFRPVNFDMGNGIVDFCSEDVGFCHVAREAGFNIWVDPTIRVGHEKRRAL